MDGKALKGYGFAYTPGSDSDEGLVAINCLRIKIMMVVLNIQAPGSFYGITFLHELSYAVGLKHPHDKGLRGQLRFPASKLRQISTGMLGTMGKTLTPGRNSVMSTRRLEMV